MVIYENIGNGLVRAYSDNGLLIHGGFPEADYEEAIDPVEKNRTYTEVVPEGDISPEQALAIITGATNNGAEGGDEV